MTTQDNNNSWFRLLAWGKQRAKSAVGIKAPTMPYDVKARNYHACLPIFVFDVQVFSGKKIQIVGYVLNILFSINLIIRYRFMRAYICVQPKICRASG